MVGLEPTTCCLRNNMPADSYPCTHVLKRILLPYIYGRYETTSALSGHTALEHPSQIPSHYFPLDVSLILCYIPLCTYDSRIFFLSASGQGLPLLFQEKGVIAIDDKRKKLMPKIVKGKLKGPPDCLLILTIDGSSNA